MAIHTDDEKNGDILGKYMYYSLPKLIIKAERVREICEQIGFPVTVNENISVTDAFRSATGEIHDRIEETYGSESGETTDLSYFFGNGNYSIASEDLSFFAQYPAKSVIDRCVVMNYFPDAANERITNMWVEVIA